MGSKDARARGKKPDRCQGQRCPPGDVVSEENGWYCLEYVQGKQKIRVWLPPDALDLQ